MKLFIITGASKGLGLAISTLLKEVGTVVDISRSSTNYSIDLANTEQIPLIIEKLFSEYAPDKFEEIVLINNAGIIQPVGQLGRISNDDINKNITINLLAPMIIANEFLKQVAEFKGEIKIVNISSGVASSPIASWLPYSASKSGLENFSRGLQIELGDRCEVYSCSPGLIDTQMQAEIRDSNQVDFPEVDRFKEFKQDGLLISPDEVAKRVLSQSKISFK